MKNTIKKVMPMRLVTLVRCVKSHRAEGKMDMILGGLKDFQCQKWVYSHAKDEETAYLEQLEKICRKIVCSRVLAWLLLFLLSIFQDASPLFPHARYEHFKHYSGL